MILISYGTRPEFIKIKPLIEEFKKNNLSFKTVFTGQQNDLTYKNADYLLNIKDGFNRLDSIFQSILNNDNIFDDVNYVMVHGDTTSALSMAVAAFHRKIKIIHLEAGLRTYDMNNPYPEEFNRQVIDKISDILFCPTEDNKNNLISDKCKGDIYVVGNTVIDNLIGRKKEIKYNNKVLVTLHRRENHDNMEKWFKELSSLAMENDDLEFVIPIHPNPSVKKHKNLLKGINVIDPLNYDDMLNEIMNCRFIISDSGGIQEESSFFNKKIIVCRKVTERPETLDINSFLCGYPEELKSHFYKIKDNYVIKNETPYGDGHASSKIVKILKDKYGFN